MRAGAVGLFVLAALGASTVPALAQDDSVRPVIRSFFVRDLGPTIQVRVFYCDNTAPVLARYRHIFRLFDASGSLVARGTTTRTSSLRCVNVGFRWRDGFPNGAYRAQVEIRNLSNGTFIRNQARRFFIS